MTHYIVIKLKCGKCGADNDIYHFSSTYNAEKGTTKFFYIFVCWYCECENRIIKTKFDETNKKDKTSHFCINQKERKI